MLFLESDNRRIESSSTPRYVGGHKTSEKPTRPNMNLLNDQIADLTVNTQQQICISNNQSCVSNTHASNSTGIRSLFRKRHKSISGQPPQVNNGSVESSPTGYQIPSSSVPIYGLKMKNIFGSNKIKVMRNDNSCDSKNNPMPDIAIDIDDEFLPSRHDTGYGSFPTNNIISTTLASPPPPINIYQSRHSTGSRHILHTNSLSYQRTSEIGSPGMSGSVGPSDFVEMFRNRAYSDVGISNEDFRKIKMKKNSTGSRASQSSVSNLDYSYCPYEARQIIIWKDLINGTQVFRLPSTEEDEILDITPSKEDNFDDFVYHRFSKSHSCYDVIPTSIKMVVLDTQLTVKKAFLALVTNNITSAPLWETKLQDFIGMLTVTDFISLMLLCHEKKESIIEASENNSISHWADILLNGRSSNLVYIPANCSLYDAVQMLERNDVHKLPVLDIQTGNIIYVLTPKCILRYMFLFFQHYELPQPPCMQKKIEEVDFYSKENLVIATPNMALSEALNLIIKKKISSIPIVDNDKKLIGLFHKDHMIAAVSNKSFKDLNITVGKALESKDHDEVFTCFKTELFGIVINRLIKNDVQQLVLVDADHRVEAVITIFDILKNLILIVEPRRASSGRGSTSGGDFDFFPPLM